MILDNIKYVDNYKGLGDVYTALKFIKDTDFSNVELGKYQLNENVYYMVQEYETKPKDVSEVHQKYIDIQYIVSGEEVIGVAPLEIEKQLTEAKPEKDVWKYTCKTQDLALYSGDFMVLYPNDIHKPGAQLNQSVKVKKVVVKVKV